MKKPHAFSNLLLGAAILAAVSSAGAQQIAFTWDDLPAHGPLPKGETRAEIGRKLIAAMKDEHLPPVYGFVNAVQLEQEPASAPMLKDWRDAGFLLGNHTWSHMNLNANSLSAWEEDLLKDEPALGHYAAGSDWHWLRFPYLAEGNSEDVKLEARKFLAAHGYKIAAVSMSFGDYMWNTTYARCVATNNTAGLAQLESSFLEAAAAEADFRRATSKALYNRDIPYVLLMHVGAFDARMLPRLLKLYRDKGFTFISLEEAEKDPFYKGSLDPSLPAQSDNIESTAPGKPLPRKPELSFDVNNACR